MIGACLNVLLPQPLEGAGIEIHSPSLLERHINSLDNKSQSYSRKCTSPFSTYSRGKKKYKKLPNVANSPKAVYTNHQDILHQHRPP
ncbi:hypothetical protein EV356DRAFT_135885 [Viridothelium virens]|uniref:Uncharacterized protein n=1 Tax=Viridothelium virens TaxID=1048519 RepID=A0A6A6H9Z3_VIRVR|nr:hypothetical protein EV356DRAFT_135885 [Viridothelium virens]